MAAPFIHLDIPEIPGDSAVAPFIGKIDCKSMSWNVTQHCDMHHSTGGTESDSSVGDVIVTKSVDKSSPNLFKDCTTGRHFPKMTLHATKAAGDAGRIEWFRIEMERCVIASVSPSIGEDGNPKETVGIHFGKYKMSHWEQKADGSQGTENPKGVDIANPTEQV